MGLFSSALGSIGMLAGGPVGSEIGSSVGGFLDDKQKADYKWKRQKRMFNWQTQWEEEKMRNAVQWQREDMKKAGINPLVAGITGGATGSGAPNPSAPEFNSSSAVDYSKGLTNLRSIDQMDKQLDIMQQDADTRELTGTAQSFKDIETAKSIPQTTKAQVQKTNAETIKTQAETDRTNAETSNIQAERKLIDEEITSKQFDNLIKKGLAEARSGNWGKWYAILNDVAQLGNEYADIYQKLKNAGKNINEIEQYTEEYTNVRGNKSRHRRTTYR